MPGTLVAYPVDDDGAALCLDADLLEAQSLDITDDADRRNDAAELGARGLPLFVGNAGDDIETALLEARHFRARDDLDALLFKALARMGGDLGVLHRQDLRQQLDDRHLGAHRAIERGELDADGARADDE